MVKGVYKWKLILTRALGRPKNRWEDDIINDMKKLKINNWTSCIQDHNKWKLLLRRPKHSKNEVVAPKEEEEFQYNEMLKNVYSYWNTLQLSAVYR
jgi:hypothetical protein